MSFISTYLYCVNNLIRILYDSKIGCKYNNEFIGDVYIIKLLSVYYVIPLKLCLHNPCPQKWGPIAFLASRPSLPEVIPCSIPLKNMSYCFEINYAHVYQPENFD